MIETASHLSHAVDWLRLLTIGLGSFVLSLSVYTSYVYLQLPQEMAPYRRHVLDMSIAMVLLTGGVVANHAAFVVRDEPFHGGSLVFPPAFLVMGYGMLRMLRVVARRRRKANGDG